MADNLGLGPGLQNLKTTQEAAERAHQLRGGGSFLDPDLLKMQQTVNAMQGPPSPGAKELAARTKVDKAKNVITGAAKYGKPLFNPNISVGGLVDLVKRNPGKSTLGFSKLAPFLARAQPLTLPLAAMGGAFESLRTPTEQFRDAHGDVTLARDLFGDSNAALAFDELMLRGEGTAREVTANMLDSLTLGGGFGQLFDPEEVTGTADRDGFFKEIENSISEGSILPKPGSYVSNEEKALMAQRQEQAKLDKIAADEAKRERQEIAEQKRRAAAEAARQRKLAERTKRLDATNLKVEDGKLVGGSKTQNQYFSNFKSNPESKFSKEQIDHLESIILREIEDEKLPLELATDIYSAYRAARR
jgi:hypothetical protein